MICEKKEIPVPPIDAQSNCNEDGAEYNQYNKWYLDGI